MATPPPARPRASRLSPERRREIYQVVLDLVLASGYEATTMEAVAARSGASKATLYRRWVDKPTLVVTAISEMSELDIASIDTGRFVDDMEATMDLLGRRAGLTVPLVLSVTEASRHDAALMEVVERYVLPELRGLQLICERGVARGEIPHPERLDRLRFLIVGALFTPTLFPAMGDRPVDGETLRAFLHDVVLPYLDVTP